MLQKLLKLLLVFTLSISSYAQVANQPNDLEVCDDDNDGFALFDLSILDAEVLGTQSAADFTVTYHETQSDADNDVNAISSPYTNVVSNLQTIYLRVEDINTDNAAMTTVNLIVNFIPMPTQPTPLELCDDDNDEIAAFDLTISNNQITAGNTTNWSVSYYESQMDAEMQLNPILTPTSYNNTYNPQTLFVTVTDVNTGCVGSTTVTLYVLPNPSGAMGIPSDLEKCDFNENETAEFDLTLNEGLINPSGEPFNITYFLSEADAFANTGVLATPDNFTNTTNPQAIYVRVESLVGCFAVTNFDIVVNPSPEVDLGMSEQNYCGFDSITLEAISPFADAYNWYKNGFILTGETSSTLIVTESDIYQVETFNTECGTSAFSELVTINFYEDAGSIEQQMITVTCEDILPDGSVNYDLDAMTSSLGYDDGFTVSYYTNLVDANQAENALVSPYNSFG